MLWKGLDLDLSEALATGGGRTFTVKKQTRVELLKGEVLQGHCTPLVCTPDLELQALLRQLGVARPA